MKNISRLVASLTITVMTMSTAVPAFAASESAAMPENSATISAEEMTQAGEYAEDEVLVVFDDSTKDRKIEKALESEGAECLEISSTSSDTKVAVAKIEKDESVSDAITKLNENEKVLYAQPNYRYEILSDYGTNDPYNNDDGLNQWYLTNIKARDAWQEMKGMQLSPVTVAVIDTGADKSHEELKNMIHPKSARVEGHEIKTLEKDSDFTGHGTHVSGIIAAEPDNGNGIAGVASGAGKDYIKVLAIDATAQDAPGEYFDTYGLISAIDYAVENGAKVINMSLGGAGVDLMLEDAVESAYEQGVTIVAAAGNENTDAAITPGDNNEVISVCNTTKEDHRYDSADFFGGSSSSNYGQAKDISAPGTTILSTVPKSADASGYAKSTGTSMATPMVSAAAAMVYAVNPSLTPAQVKNILCATARDIGDEGFDYYTGYGVVNILDAVKAAKNAGKDLAVSSIEFKEDSSYIEHIDLGERKMLEVLIKPAESLADVTWSSSDESVVTVDHKGKIYGAGVGQAVITCSAGKVSAEYTVKVCSVNLPTSITITNAENAQNMKIGESFYLQSEVLPRYADNGQMYWKSSDKSIVTVDEQGLVTARNVGTAKILGYVYNSKYKDFSALPQEGDPLTAVVNVSVVESADAVTLEQAPTKVKLGTKATFTAKTTLKGEPLPQDVTWSSSNRSVASINGATGVLTPVKPGKTTICASLSNGVNASVRITVYKTDYKSSDYNLAVRSAGYNSVKLAWKAIPNADGYRIYRNGEAIKDTTSTTFTNSKLTCGKSYRYSVRAYYKVDGKKDLCKASSVKTGKPSLSTPVAKATTKKGKITLSWRSVKGASGYVVYKYSKDKKKYVRKATVKKASLTDTSVKSGKTYSYKVRAYRTVSGKKVYSEYSKAVKKTAK